MEIFRDIQAITLDLDDTLWPFAMVGHQVEAAVHEWLERHLPETAQAFPPARMRALRAAVQAQHPELALDMGALRRKTLESALAQTGASLDHVDALYEVFVAARNRVTFFDDSLQALREFAAVMPVVALTNGNADLKRIGIDGYFAGIVSAQSCGAAKPSRSIFDAACAALGLAPQHILHAGDHIEEDVLGAKSAGLRGVWVNRDGRVWPYTDVQPDAQCDTLAQLASWLKEART